MYLNLARELKKNTEIMEGTFRKFNMKVLQFSYRPYYDDNSDFECIIELASDDDSMEKDAMIKINLYNNEGEIIISGSQRIYSDEFMGYDTFKLALLDNGRALLSAKSARIYMTIA